MHRYVVSLGVVVMLTATTAPAYSRSCQSFQLDAKHSAVDISSSYFSVVNAGPGSVGIPEADVVFPPDKNMIQGFAGDSGHTYRLVLVGKSQPAEVMICVG